MPNIADYEKFTDKETIYELKALGRKLKGRTVQCISSSKVGGGVAEILTSIVPLFNEVGLKAKWDTVSLDPTFLHYVKMFQNGLDGDSLNITIEMFKNYMKAGEELIKNTKLYGDIIFVHDLHPVLLINRRAEMDAKWIWRCHFDLSKPDREVWRFLSDFIEDYDGVVFSSPNFAQQMSAPQYFIPPSIDPLSPKNRPMAQEEIKGVLKKYGLSRKKPMILQVGRYDHVKDPLGVIDVYRLVKKYIDCQLVLASNKASDDVYTDKVIEEVKEKAGKDPDIHILVMETADTDINALQRSADVVIQKSIKEGFALSVTEALWKEKPVVGAYVGGIPLQVIHNYSGFLSRTIGGSAFYIRKILNNPAIAQKLGQNGKEMVKKNFICTRQLRDYMLLFLHLFHPGDIVSLYS